MIIIICKDQILKADRISIVDVGDGKDWNVLAKMPRETVVLGTYSKAQAKEILDAVRFEVTVSASGVYEMPERHI